MGRHPRTVASHVILIGACAAAGLAVRASPVLEAQAAPSVQDTLARVGDRVAEWFTRARSVMSDERVSIQSLRADMTSDTPPRRLDFELRVAWDPDEALAGAPVEARVMRQLVRVNGRAPRPRDEAGCLDPKNATPEALAMFLPEKRADFQFSHAGRTTIGGRAALMLDYRPRTRRIPDVTWRADCVTVDLPGWTAGRVWIDAETHDVLRLDERLTGQYEFNVPREHQRRGAPRWMVIERADSSVRYRRVEFADPPETLMLPQNVDVVTVFRGAGIQRHRIRQQYSGYRRFLADARVVP